MKKFLGKLLKTLLVLAAVVLVFHLVENWRGEHAWNVYQTERAAKGDVFDWDQLAPPATTPDQDFARTPSLAELFPKPPAKTKIDSAALPECKAAAGNWRLGRPEHLAAWPGCLKNQDLKAFFAEREALLNEITEASKRPGCRFPVAYETTFSPETPHVIRLRNLARLYRLRALVSLADGKTDAALADVQTCLRLAEALRFEPAFLPQMGRAAILDLALQPVWEGIADHRWTEPQLAAFQEALGKMDLLDGLSRALKGERLSMYSNINQLLEKSSWERAKVLNGQGETKMVSNFNTFTAWLLFPKGWFYQNRLVMDRYFTEHILPSVDWKLRRMDPGKIQQAEAGVEKVTGGPYSLLLKMATPAFQGSARRIAHVQTAMQQAVLACALERQHLAKKAYPDALEVLVPQYLPALPTDVITGNIYTYHRTPEGSFLLYSFGWDGKDDGGIPAADKNAPVLQDIDKGDWAWPAKTSK